MLYIGVFLLGGIIGTVFMAFVAGASRSDQCEDCNQLKGKMTENTKVPKGWTHEDMTSQGG